MKTGIVNFFNQEKGFGFITEDNGNEIFFHVSGMKDEIKLNDRVCFLTREIKSGIAAFDICLETGIKDKLQSSH